MAHNQNQDLLELGSITDLDLSVSSDQLDTQDRAVLHVPDNGPAVSNNPDNVYILAELQRLHSALGNSKRQLDELRAERRSEHESRDLNREDGRPPVERLHFPFAEVGIAESSPVRELKFAATGLTHGPPEGVRFSLPSLTESSRYATIASGLPISAVSSSLTVSTQPTLTYSSPIMTPSFSESSKPLPSRTIPPNSDNRLDAIENQLAMITRSVSMLTQIIAKAYKPKAVPPRKFNAAKEHNLRTFFKQFERYCQVTYPDQPEDWVIVLGNFLEGSYSDLYDQIIREEISYSAIKDALLQWWDYEAGVRKDKASQEFMLAKRKPGESVNMFALRLEQLANRAYPGVSMRAHDNLRRAFLHNLPAVVEQRIHDYILNHEGATGQKMQFDQIVRLANQHCNELSAEQIEEPEVITISQVKTSQQKRDAWSEMVGRYARKPNNSDRAVVESVPTTLPKSTNNRSSRSNNHGNGNLSPKTGKNSSKFLFCTHCGKNNHTLSDCYGYNNVCVYCKQQGHSNIDCPEIKQKRSNQSLQTAQIPTLECPYCSAGHLGKDCPSHGSSRPKGREGPLPQQNNQWGTVNNTCSACGGTHSAGACGGTPALN